MGDYFLGILVVLLVLFPNLFFFLFPSKNKPDGVEPEPVVLTILENVGRFGCFFVPVIFAKKVGEQDFSVLVIFMAVCLLVYYFCWIRYFVGDRVYFDLFKPLLFFPIPMAVFPILYFVFLGVWVKSLVFIIPAVVFAIGHIVISWRTYKALR